MKSHRVNHAPLCLLTLAIGMAVSVTALAGPADQVYTPVVVKGEKEFEFRGGYRDFNRAPSEHAFVVDAGIGVTSWWKTELVLEYAAEGGNAGKLEAMEWENVFALTEPGKYWADYGLFVEYENVFANGPDLLKIGPMLQREGTSTITNVNLLFTREIGTDASHETGLDYAWQVKWRGNEAMEWGVQGLGSLGPVDHLGQDDSHIAGPAVFGVRRLAGGRKFSYDAAVLAGLNSAAPDLTVRFKLEYEIY